LVAGKTATFIFLADRFLAHRSELSVYIIQQIFHPDDRFNTLNHYFPEMSARAEDAGAGQNFHYTTISKICQVKVRKNFAQIFFPKLPDFCAVLPKIYHFNALNH